MEDSDGVYVPPSTQNECRIYFPVDNCDFQSSLPDEKHEFHGTVQIVYQNSTNPPESKSLKIERNQNKTVDLNHSLQKRLYQNLYLLNITIRKLKTIHQVSNITAILICFGSQ